MGEERTMVVVMMNSRSRPESNPSSSRKVSFNISEITTSSTSPSWKLYENPFYYSQQRNLHRPHHHQHQHHYQQEWHSSTSTSNTKQLHRLHLPLTARKAATSFWDLPFFKPIMSSDQLEIARAQIIELKAEIEFERKLRKKTEVMNKKLARELSEERKGKEALKKVCEELANDFSFKKEEADRMSKEIEEERKMIKISEVLREERVQMKLADAKLFFEEKMLELEAFKRKQNEESNSKLEQKNRIDNLRGTGNSSASVSSFSRESTRSAFLSERPDIVNSSSAVPRKASPEPENPHIKRGIKGFVEFPKVVRAIGSKSRNWGNKLECQKAQLRVLLKQKTPIRSDNLVVS